jgi:hypothetical protein
MTGVGTLRTRLSKLLYGHLKRELPGLKVELDNMMVSTGQELSLMGQKRSGLAEQKLFLMKICVEANRIMEAATDGNYEHPFFGYVDWEAPVDDGKNIRRLRAVVQHLNVQFAQTMRERGRKYAIADTCNPKMDADITETAEGNQTAKESEEEEEEEETGDVRSCTDTVFSGRSTYLTRAQAVNWVQRLLERSRGNELVGIFNPRLIGQLFREQSEHWGAIATAHINRLVQTCRDFVLLALGNVTSEDIRDNLLGLTIDRALKNAHLAAVEELQRILKDKDRAPSTYNHYFTTTLQKMHRDKYEKQLNEATGAAKVKVWNTAGTASTTYLQPETFRSTMDKSIELDMDKFSAEQALDVQAAFYKVCRNSACI